MFIAAIVVGVAALIGMVILFIEGVVTMLSRNQIRRGLHYIGGAALLGVLAALMVFYVLYAITPAQTT